MQQMSLLPDTIEQQFVAFHHENPQVYKALVDMARRWKQAGNEVCGIGMLFEVLRWEVGIATRGDQFTLNNNYRSRYARLIAANEPDLADMFHMRRLREAW